MADFSLNDFLQLEEDAEFIRQLANNDTDTTLISPEGKTGKPALIVIAGMEADGQSKVDSIAAVLSSAATVAIGSMSDAVGVVDVAGGVATGSINDAVAGVESLASDAGDSIAAEESEFSVLIQEKSVSVTEAASDFVSDRSAATVSLTEIMQEDLDAWRARANTDLQDLENSAHTELHDVVTTSKAVIANYEQAARTTSLQASPLLAYALESLFYPAVDLTPVAGTIAIAWDTMKFYRKDGDPGDGGWTITTGSFATRARSSDFGIVHDGFSGSPTNQADAVSVMVDAVIAAGHRKIEIEPSAATGEALLVNRWDPKFWTCDWSFHKDVILIGTNNIPYKCKRTDGFEIYLPNFNRETIAGGGSTRNNYAHQPDLKFYKGKLYAVHPWNETSNEEQDDGQIGKLHRRNLDLTWTDLGAPWYDGTYTTNPWNPATNNEKMLQLRLAAVDDELWVKQHCGRSSTDNGMMLSRQPEEDGDWTNYFLWFSDATGEPIVTTDLTAPSGYKHTRMINGVEYFPYAPGGILVTDSGRVVVLMTYVPTSGNVNDVNKIHIPLYTDDRVNWFHGRPVPYGEIEPHQAWEMRGARVVTDDGRELYIAMNRTNTKDGTVTEHRGRRHAVSYSADGVIWSPWQLLDSELPLDTVCPLPLNSTHMIYPAANSLVRRTAQSLNLLRAPFNAIIPGPRMSAEERLGENFYRHDPVDDADTIITPDFTITGQAKRLRARGWDGEWYILSEANGDYEIDLGLNEVRYLAGPASDYRWYEYRELKGEKSEVSIAEVNYETGEIVCAWAQSREVDEQVGGTEIVVASTYDLPKPNMANVMPTDAAEVARGEEGHAFIADLINNKLTITGGGYASVDIPRDGVPQIAVPYELDAAPEATKPAVMATIGGVAQYLTVEIDKDLDRLYRRVRRTSNYDGAGQRGRTAALSDRPLLDLELSDAILIRPHFKTGWVTAVDDVFAEVGTPINLKLGDGMQTSEAPAYRELVFDLAAASIVVMPDSFSEPSPRLLPGLAPNLMTDPNLRNPLEPRDWVKLVAGEPFAPNWFCITTGGAEIWGRPAESGIGVANEDAGGDRESYLFDVRSAGTGDFVFQHVFEGTDALQGVPHSFEAQFKNRTAEFGAIQDLEMYLDFLVYPNNNLYQPKLANFLSRRISGEWFGIYGVLPIPLWEEANSKPLSVENSLGAMRFVVPATSVYQLDMRWPDFRPGVGRRPFHKPQPGDQQRRTDRVVQVIDAEKVNGVLLKGGAVHTNGDGTYSFRAGRSLREKMRKGPKATFRGGFAVRGRNGAAVVSEAISPTLTQSDDDFIEVGCDTLGDAGWADVVQADLIGTSTFSERLFGDAGLRKHTLQNIMTDDPENIAFSKVNVASGTETMSQPEDALFIPPGEPWTDGPFQGNGLDTEIETTIELSTASTTDVMQWDSVAQTERLLDEGQFSVVPDDPISGSNATVILGATPADSIFTSIAKRASADTFAHADLLGNIVAGDTVIVEELDRGASSIALEAYPSFYGQIAAVTSAYVEAFTTAPTMQLQEAIDRFLSRANDWGLLPGADRLFILGLHNEADSLRDAMGSGVAANFGGTYDWRRHHGFIGTGFSDANIQTNHTPDGFGNYKQDDASIMVFTQRTSAGAAHYLWGAGGSYAGYAPDWGDGQDQARANTTVAIGDDMFLNQRDEPAFFAISREDAAGFTLYGEANRGLFRPRPYVSPSTGLPSGQIFGNRLGTSYGQHEVLGMALGKGFAQADMRRWSILWHELARHLTVVPYYDN